MKERIYQAAIYLRLSKEDGDVVDSTGKTGSDSINNQRKLINEFLKTHNNIKVVSERVDDGYSGTNFERPAFTAMMEDIKAGLVDCVICKDLSRFGREYIGTGKYIERIFPSMGVRFIAVTDNIDSINKSSQADEIIVPFKNLINDAYARDISMKVRSHLEIKRKNGEFIGAFCPYGYKKSESNKNALEIDVLAANVVKEIFKMKLNGMSQDAIANKLNDEQVPSPLEYKLQNGENLNTSFKTNEKALWSSKTIKRILENRYYIGEMIQGRVTTANHKIKKRIEKPEDECVIVKDLSRLGRNYIETGTIIERVFHFFGVRFISVTDDFDSDKDEVDLSIPLKNIVNEFYAKDISHKILTSLDAKFKRGECAVSRLPYGYKKDPVDSHKMIIDDAVADNVKLMFRMTLDGCKTSEIRRYLNDNNVMTPAAYKDFVRLGYVREQTNTFWSETGIKKILRNYNYVGDTAHGMKSGSKYTTDKYKERPMEDWLIVENTHEAIISKEDYFAVQEILKKRQKQYANDTKDWIHIQEKNKYGNKIICGHCEKKALMTGRRDRRRNSFKIMYMCQNLKNCRTGAAQYKGHFMYDTNIDAAVYAVIRDHIKGCLDAEAVVKMANKSQKSIKQHGIFARNVLRARAEMQTVKELKADLFADYSQNLINAEQYIQFTEQYNVKLKQLKTRLEENLKMQAKYSKNFEIDKDWKVVIEKYKSKRSLSKEMIDAFVEKVVIWDKKNIEVHLKYDDLFNELLELRKEREVE